MEKYLNMHYQVLNHAYTKEDKNQVKTWNYFANITNTQTCKLEA